MPGTKFLLGMEEPEGFMVTVEGEVGVEKVMLPEFNGLDHGIEFSVIVSVLDLCLAQFLTEI